MKPHVPCPRARFRALLAWLSAAWLALGLGAWLTLPPLFADPRSSLAVVSSVCVAGVAIFASLLPLRLVPGGLAWTTPTGLAAGPLIRMGAAVAGLILEVRAAGLPAAACAVTLLAMMLPLLALECWLLARGARAATGGDPESETTA